MKTALICSTWLDTTDYLAKTLKFLDYYTNQKMLEALNITTKDIWLVDNASDEKLLDWVKTKYNVSVYRYEKHLPRTAHLEYPYCWRQLYFGRHLFQEYDYEKVVHLNNDVFIVSNLAVQKIKQTKNGEYWCPWCPKHNFPECDLQIYTKDSDAYWNMTAVPYMTYNGQHMELIIPAMVDKELVSDRHSEYGITQQEPNWDISCQVKYEMKIAINF